MKYTQSDARKLPLIESVTDLKVGNYYRIKPVNNTQNEKILSIAIYTEKEEMIRIMLSPTPWSHTKQNDSVIEKGDEIIVKITNHLQTIDEVQGRFKRRVFQYEGRAIANLTNTQRLFEYAITDLT